ncbi:MAG: hypothetical protein AAFY21_18365, partial [Cyanobacteria bacterium J06641_2]
KRGYLLFLTVIALYGLSIFRVSGGGFTYMAVVNYIAQFILIFTFLYTFINPAPQFLFPRERKIETLIKMPLNLVNMGNG